jgi:hypothetical protein
MRAGSLSWAWLRGVTWRALSRGGLELRLPIQKFTIRDCIGRRLINTLGNIPIGGLISIHLPPHYLFIQEVPIIPEISSLSAE